MDTIVICAVLQDAAPRILEWIAFHRLIGVDRFALYDLRSSDGAAALVARSRFGRQASVIDWSRNGGRAAAHADFAANHANRFTWAIIIEPDEFIHPLGTDSIRPLLPRYDGFSAVSLRRLTFDMSGQQTRPGQLVIAHYTSRVAGGPALNAAAPTLLRTADLRGVGGTPPGFALAGGICNARGEPVPAAAQACDDMMVVNRYPARPASEGRAVEATGGAFAAAVPSGTTSGQPLSAAEAQATVPDRRIMRFIPRLRAMLHDAALAAPAVPVQPPATSAASQPAGPLLLGIGIVTYNRRPILSETLDRVLRHTRHPRTIVAVADDGSTDGTLDMLRERQVLTVTGRNMSIAWNKNRALFLLSELLRCDVVVLLEDDAYPSQDHWEVEWMNAAIRWGHANVAGRWLQEYFVPGNAAGTADDPIHSDRITAQCAVFSREALLFGGYFDTRFREYGHEHVEHTRRLLRLGYGGTEGPVNGRSGPLFKLLWGSINYHLVPSVVEAKDEQAERNRVVAQSLFGDFSYRAPWRNEDEARQLRDEMRHSFPRAVL
ncbi:MAG TPA: glycosyltransferase family 2 protein [Acetobacteraceae bacterium]|nr:glycosyltransferase family 2 protein [Acetobacteraceae bacterium]